MVELGFVGGGGVGLRVGGVLDGSMRKMRRCQRGLMRASIAEDVWNVTNVPKVTGGKKKRVAIVGAGLGGESS